MVQSKHKLWSDTTDRIEMKTTTGNTPKLVEGFSANSQLTPNEDKWMEAAQFPKLIMTIP